MSDNRDYYCSYKFKYLKLDLVNNATLNCHAARQHTIDFSWLKKNKGQLFNTELNVAERKMMLANQRNSSCEEICWPLEDQGVISPRIWQNGKTQTHVSPVTQPEILEIKINDNCNMSCSYCCKESSSSWRRDLQIHGPYSADFKNRYRLTDRDKMMIKVSQNEVKNTTRFQILLDEIKCFSANLKELVITGGEPLLDNQLFAVINAVANTATKINIYTGLGVDTKRFTRMLHRIQDIPNVMISVSAECTGKFYEFNRYGNQWNEFIEKITMLEQSNIELRFSTCITNLTVIDLAAFIKLFQNHRIGLVFANQPEMSAPYVLDPDTKNHILKDIESLPNIYREQIAQSIQAQPSEWQREQTSIFLKEYASRRDLDLNIYPITFLKWLNINVV